MSPLVTVYIPCRNYGRFLRQSIESVFSQLYVNWELIIIDEASEDDSLTIAQELCRKFPDKTLIIKNETPIGLQKLANKVLGMANGKYLVRLDADDWFDEAALLLMVTKLEASPNVGLVFGNYYYTNEGGEVIGFERRHALGFKDQNAHLPPHGACTMFRTRSMKVAGGYSEEINAQDGWELWYKLFSRIGVANLEAPLFYYRQHGNSLSRDNSRLLRARGQIFEKLSQKISGDFKPITVAVIPVKESYPQFEGVPYRVFQEKSLLERAINSAANAENVTCIIVSSSSPNVLDFSENLEIEGKVAKHIRLLRKQDDITSKVPIREFMISAGDAYFKNEGVYPDIVSFLSLHALNRTSMHIDNALCMLKVTEADTVVSVQEEREPVFSYQKNGLKLLNPGRFQDLQYDRERLFKFNGCLIASWWEILKEHHLFGEKIVSMEMTESESFQVKNAHSLKSINNEKD